MKKELSAEIVDILIEKSIVCKQLTLVENKKLDTRKNIACFLGVDTKTNYIGVWRRFSKSRFLVKEFEEFIILKERLEALGSHRVLKNLLIVDSPICSKALHVMDKKGWKVHNVSV